jgi:hypothetical protein
LAGELKTVAILSDHAAPHDDLSPVDAAQSRKTQMENTARRILDGGKQAWSPQPKRAMVCSNDGAATAVRQTEMVDNKLRCREVQNCSFCSVFFYLIHHRSPPRL